MADAECAVAGCGVVMSGRGARRGYCVKHYQRWVRHGDPEVTARRTTDAVLCRDERGCKQCFTCEQWLPEARFGKRSGAPDGLSHDCKECKWGRWIQAKYGISPAWYQEQLNRQGGACGNPACGRTAPGGQGERWCIDHDHSCCPGTKSCGRCVRGLLCPNCNTALGLARDDADVLAGLISYVRDACYAVGGKNANEVKRPWDREGGVS